MLCTCCPQVHTFHHASILPGARLSELPACCSCLQDAEGRSLWDLTFSKVHNISSGLNPGMLEATLDEEGRLVVEKAIPGGILVEDDLAGDDEADGSGERAVACVCTDAVNMSYG